MSIQFSYRRIESDNLSSWEEWGASAYGPDLGIADEWTPGREIVVVTKSGESRTHRIACLVEWMEYGNGNTKLVVALMDEGSAARFEQAQAPAPAKPTTLPSIVGSVVDAGSLTVGDEVAIEGEAYVVTYLGGAYNLQGRQVQEVAVEPAGITSPQVQPEPFDATLDHHVAAHTAVMQTLQAEGAETWPEAKLIDAYENAMAAKGILRSLRSR